MTHLFIDTGAWYALADPTDPHHDAAIRFRNTLNKTYRLITTNYVLDELYTLLLFSVGYHQTLLFESKLAILRQQGILEVAWISEDLADLAWKTFERFNADKRWSFTDCTSYIVMQEYHITEAFAFDHHFSQMGILRRP